MRFIRSLAALALLAGVLGVSAAEPPASKPKEDEGKPAKKADGKLDHKSLKTMLENLGYEVKPYGKDKTSYSFMVKLERFNAAVSVSLSQDQTRLWLVANSPKIANTKAIPAGVMRKLVQWNKTVAPCFFTFNEKAGYVYLLHTVPNKDIDAEFLSTMIEVFAGTIKKTWKDWNAAALNPQTVAKSKP